MTTVVYEGELLTHPQGEHVWLQITKEKIVWKAIENEISPKCNTETSKEPIISPSTSSNQSTRAHSISEELTKNDKKENIPQKNFLKRRSSFQKATVTHSLILRDLSGCEAARGPEKKDITCYLRVYAYPYHKSPFSKSTFRRRREVLFACSKYKTFAENHEEISRWRVQIKGLLKPHSQKQLLVLLNPFGGAGKALEIFHFYATPILAEAGLQYTCIKTEYAGHARKIARELLLDQWGGVVLTSGDGLVHEVLNGLMEHEQRNKALQMPIGVIPAGSANALAASLLFQAGEEYKHNMVQASCLMLANCRIKEMDVVVLEMADQSQQLSILSVAWGIISDVDIESENYRLLGKARFTIGTIKRLIHLRKYSGTLSFLPHDPSFQSKFSSSSASTTSTNPTPQNDTNHVTPDANNNNCNESEISHITSNIANNPVNFDDIDNVKDDDDKDNKDNNENEENFVMNTSFSGEIRTEVLTNVSSTGGLSNISGKSTKDDIPPPSKDIPPNKSPISTPLLPPLSEEVPDDWTRVMGDDFISVLALYQSHLGQDMLLIPSSRINDNLIYLLIIKGNPSKTRMFRYFSCLENGTFCDFDDPFIEVVKVKAFRIEPRQDVTNGIMTVDGERVPYGSIQGQKLASVARGLSF